MKNLFISFDDSRRDPTYASAFECMLVQVSNPDIDSNPCSEEAIAKTKATQIPLVPSTEEELRKFAKMFGWTVKVKAGTMILVTDVKVK